MFPSRPRRQPSLDLRMAVDGVVFCDAVGDELIVSLGLEAALKSKG